MATSTNKRASLVSHSRTNRGHEAVTYFLRYERFIHAELMAHRTSRNASSSRAIPLQRMAAWIEEDPALPLHLGRKQKGMKSSDLAVEDPRKILDLIAEHREASLRIAREMDALGLHKEHANRYLEAHGKINVIFTCGHRQLMNLFALRIVPPGESQVNDNMQALVVEMAWAYRRSRPKFLLPGDWHLPFVGDEERGAWPIERQIARSAARCGWTSYQTVDGRDSDWDDELRMHDNLVADKHCSPLEHQLQARPDDGKIGLVPGFDSYRHMIPNESAEVFDFDMLDRYFPQGEAFA